MSIVTHQQSKFLICPRCESELILEYDETIECMHCRLEFDKYDIETYNKDQILSLQEKRAFFSIF